MNVGIRRKQFSSWTNQLLGTMGGVSGEKNRGDVAGQGSPVVS